MKGRHSTVWILLIAFWGCGGAGGAAATGPDAETEPDAAAQDILAAEDLAMEVQGDAMDVIPEEDLAEPDIPSPSLPVVLMSGFEPFGGYVTNPSIDALLALDGQVIAGLAVHMVELPVEWDEAWEVLYDEIRILRPRVVIATGMAGTHSMRYEIRAVNEEWGVDNVGIDPEGEPVIPDGPETLAPSLPVDIMAAAVEHAGLATLISEDAGTYLCNHVMYHLLHYAEFESQEALAAGFVHVPPAPYEGPMTVEDITDAHIIGLDVIATWLEEGAPVHKPVPQTDIPPVYFLPGYE